VFFKVNKVNINFFEHFASGPSYRGRRAASQSMVELRQRQRALEEQLDHENLQIRIQVRQPQNKSGRSPNAAALGLRVNGGRLPEKGQENRQMKRLKLADI